jgi:uncharacterized repeat protein (TIGR03803 family)
MRRLLFCSLLAFDLVFIRFTVFIFLSSLSVQAGSTSGKFGVVYSFKGGNDGSSPAGALVFDSAGSLYGTTQQGGGSGNCSEGVSGCGIAFELHPRSSGGWKETVLHRFQNGSDGAAPNGSLILDSSGNVYGTTLEGGMAESDNCGTVYSLIPARAGWTEKIIYTFCSQGGDGYFPASGLIADQTGNLYGTTSSGGNDLGGTIFELSPGANGWTWSLLRGLCLIGNCARDGANPDASLVWHSGRLFSTTPMGGKQERYCGGFPGGCGVIFELSLSKGVWKEKVLHSFLGVQGVQPSAKITFDKSSNLYGTTEFGGVFGHGTAFKLFQDVGGWKYTVIYNFRSGNLHTALALDAAGNLYGATKSGGEGVCSGGCGEVYKLTPTERGGWTYTMLHGFSGESDGGQPSGDLIFGPDGRLYGVASIGGSGGNGVVFAIMP